MVHLVDGPQGLRAVDPDVHQEGHCVVDGQADDKAWHDRKARDRLGHARHSQPRSTGWNTNVVMRFAPVATRYHAPSVAAMNGRASPLGAN